LRTSPTDSQHNKSSGDMAKRGPKEKPVPIEKVEQLARAGMQTEEIATEMNMHLSTFYKKAEENCEILEAYKRGHSMWKGNSCPTAGR